MWAYKNSRSCSGAATCVAVQAASCIQHSQLLSFDIRLWSTQLFGASTMSNRIFYHQVPAVPRRGWREVNITQKKTSRSRRAVHNTVYQSPQRRQPATPTSTTPSAPNHTSPPPEQDTTEHESPPLRIGKASDIDTHNGILLNLCTVTKRLSSRASHTNAYVDAGHCCAWRAPLKHSLLRMQECKRIVEVPWLPR